MTRLPQRATESVSNSLSVSLKSSLWTTAQDHRGLCYLPLFTACLFRAWWASFPDWQLNFWAVSRLCPGLEDIAQNQPSLLEDTGPKTQTAGLNHGLSLGIRNVWGPHGDNELSQSHLWRKYLNEKVICVKSSGFVPKTKKVLNWKLNKKGQKETYFH